MICVLVRVDFVTTIGLFMFQGQFHTFNSFVSWWPGPVGSTLARRLDHRHLEVTVSFSHWAVTCNPCVWKVNLFHILEAEDWTTVVLGADFLYPFIFGRCWWGSCCLGENMLKVRGNMNKLRDKINAIAHCHSWNNPAQQHASPAWPFLVTW